MIDLDRTDEWVQLCELNEKNELCFTKEYLKLTSHLGWDARKFVAHLVVGWEPKYQTALDYFGPDDADEDWYSGIDGEGMDVGEIIPDTLEVEGVPYKGLESDWYRDIMRAQLITIKLPTSLIEKYVEVVKKNKEK